MTVFTNLIPWDTIALCQHEYMRKKQKGWHWSWKCSFL